jgi:DNA-binding HxlR family transcriptional regulator
MTPRRNFDHLPHGLARALSVVGEWWTPLVIVAINEGNHRFEAIQTSLDIARNILTDRLTTLVDNGLVHKIEYSTRPKRYEYHLTDAAQELISIFGDLSEWGNKWFGDDGDNGSAGVPARV